MSPKARFVLGGGGHRRRLDLCRRAPHHLDSCWGWKRMPTPPRFVPMVEVDGEAKEPPPTVMTVCALESTVSCCLVWWEEEQQGGVHDNIEDLGWVPIGFGGGDGADLGEGEAWP